MDKKMDQGTEDQILDAAYRIILQKGKAGSRMQEIADEAGVNKALLHYYFRSKDKIYTAVMQRIIRELLKTVAGNLDFTSPFEDLIRSFVKYHIRTLRKNRKLIPFFFSELQFNNRELAALLNNALTRDDMNLPDQFYKRTLQAIEDREIREIEPLQLLMNVISLNVFYFLAMPAFSTIFDLTEENRKSLETDRAVEVADFIWESIRYRGKSL